MRAGLLTIALFPGPANSDFHKGSPRQPEKRQFSPSGLSLHHVQDLVHVLQAAVWPPGVHLAGHLAALAGRGSGDPKAFQEQLQASAGPIWLARPAFCPEGARVVACPAASLADQRVANLQEVTLQRH